MTTEEKISSPTSKEDRELFNKINDLIDESTLSDDLKVNVLLMLLAHNFGFQNLLRYFSSILK